MCIFPPTFVRILCIRKLLTKNHRLTWVCKWRSPYWREGNEQILFAVIFAFPLCPKIYLDSKCYCILYSRHILLPSTLFSSVNYLFDQGQNQRKQLWYLLMTNFKLWEWKQYCLPWIPLFKLLFEILLNKNMQHFKCEVNLRCN